MHKKTIFIVALLAAFPLLSAHAQSDSGGSAPIETSTAASVEPAPVSQSRASSSIETPMSALEASTSVTPRGIPVQAPAGPGSQNPRPNISEPGNAPTATIPVIDFLSPKKRSPNIPLILALAGAALLGSYGALKMTQRNKKQREKSGEKNENSCDSVRELLEQKKKELEDMVRNLPKEKIKEFGKDAVLTELKKDKEIEKILDAAESAKDRYEKLKGTIELLQKRFDLCMLSLPGKGTASYKGTIIENSLSDRGILENLKITKKYGSGDRSLNDVVVNEKQIEKLGTYLNDGPWHMHFWQPEKDDVIVVFKDKNFRIKHSDKNTWREAVQYGKSKGIPEEQLDFMVH